ncbi:MAG TPA: hypothetical protein VGM52_18765 [Herbaspirillum sp.]
MPFPIPSTSSAAASAAAGASTSAAKSGRTPRSPFADAFAEARNDPNCVVFDMRRGARQFEQAPAAQPASAPPTKAQASREEEKQVRQNEQYQNLSDLCSQFGLASINDTYAGKARALNHFEVIERIERRTGDNFSRKGKDGTNLSDSMKFSASKTGLQTVAAAMSETGKSSVPSGKTVYVGLGMTTARIQELHALTQNAKTTGIMGTANAGKFFLVNEDRATEVTAAKGYAKDQKQVLLEIKGISNKCLRPRGGGANSKETLFGPHATFNVTAVGPGSNNIDLIIVRLTEIASSQGATTLFS